MFSLVIMTSKPCFQVSSCISLLDICLTHRNTQDYDDCECSCFFSAAVSESHIHIKQPKHLNASNCTESSGKSALLIEHFLSSFSFQLFASSVYSASFLHKDQSEHSSFLEQATLSMEDLFSNSD